MAGVMTMVGMMIGNRMPRALDRGLVAAGAFFAFMIAAEVSAQDIQLEDVVTAEIEMPEAFYVLRASRLHYEAMEPRDSFLPELYETVEKEPF